MFRVGLTGGIGSGKTTVANLFSKHNIPVLDTDLIAHQITLTDGPAYQAVIDIFGADIIAANNTIDRKKLANIVFHSEEKKIQLENLLHPMIWDIVEQQVAESSAPYCIIVVPLLFEGGHQLRFDSTLAVDSPEQLRIQRVINRDHRTVDDVKVIIKNQILADKRLELADDIITNNGSIDSLQTEVDQLHKKYLSLSDYPLSQ